ncbi:MAG: methylmalonyl Co-A mutase-associated GTPase MeaB, partial [Ignavibacteria bacterium]
IAQTADTTIITLVPESGDSVQTMKAGLMEIGDIFIINKSDREGSDTLALALKTMLHLKRKDGDGWGIKVIKTVGTQNKGIEELYKEILRHKAHLESKGKLAEKRKEHLVKQISELVNSKLELDFWSKERKSRLDKSLDKIIKREVNPYDFVDKLFQN